MKIGKKMSPTVFVKFPLLKIICRLRETNLIVVAIIRPVQIYVALGGNSFCKESSAVLTALNIEHI